MLEHCFLQTANKTANFRELRTHRLNCITLSLPTEQLFKPASRDKKKSRPILSDLSVDAPRGPTINASELDAFWINLSIGKAVNELQVYCPPT